MSFFTSGKNLLAEQAHCELFITWRFNKSVFDIISAIVLCTFVLIVHFL